MKFQLTFLMPSFFVGSTKLSTLASTSPLTWFLPLVVGAAAVKLDSFLFLFEFDKQDRL